MTPPLPSPLAPAQILAGYFADATRQLAAALTTPKGRTPSAQAFNRQRSASILNQIDRIRQRLNLDLSNWVSESIRPAYQQGIKDAIRLAREVGIRGRGGILGGATTRIDVAPLQLVARDTADDLLRASSATFDRASKLLRATAENGLTNADINKAIARGIITGERAEVVRSLRDDFRAVSNGKLVIINKNGDPMEYDPGEYAELVFLNRSREANTAARTEAWASSGVDLVRVDGRITKRFCSAYVGQVFSLSGAHPKYPPFSRLPRFPMHVRCSKTVAPFDVELATPAQLRRAEPSADVAKMLETRDTQALARRFTDLQLYTQVRDRFGMKGGNAA